MDNEIILGIRNGLDSLTEATHGILTVCAYFICALLLFVALYTAFAEIKAVIKHEEPNRIDGAEPPSTKKVLSADAIMIAIAVIIFVLI